MEKHIDCDVDIETDSDYRWKYNQISLHFTEKVLDIGCGDGRICKLSKKWYGIDIKKDINFDESVNDRFNIGSVLDIPYCDNEFDGVIISHVLEHIDQKNVGLAINEIVRVVKEGGFVMVYSPNPFSAYFHNTIGHINCMSLFCMRREFEKIGCETIYMGYSIWRRLHWKLQKMLHLFFPYIPSEYYIKFRK